MNRHDIIETIGANYMTSNIEAGEYSYIQAAGGRAQLRRALGRDFEHFKLDIRFEFEDIVLLIETKQEFVESDTLQLIDYVEEEKALHPGKKIIAMLANTRNDRIRVWKEEIDNAHLLINEDILQNMNHYIRLFDIALSNDRETVLKNTFALNELLHKNDISENLRSQFVGTTLLYIKKLVRNIGATSIDEALRNRLRTMWSVMSEAEIRAGIAQTLTELLDGSENKQKKIELLQKNVLNDQKVRKLTKQNWIRILETILFDIYRYINADSSEGQDILNMFFIAFNKYTGKADKNQAFTPDHITDFMCRITDVDRNKVVLDATCGSGSFLVQAMVKEIADCHRGRTDEEAATLIRQVKERHIFGIEVEEKAYGLSTTNMLIHGDGNSNIKFASCFDCEDFIKSADPDIILMNPPYNAKPIGIPDVYKTSWGNAVDGKEDPTKGYVFIQFLSDVVKRHNLERETNGQGPKEVKLAVLLPQAAAIGSNDILADVKRKLLEDNRLEAVFTLPYEVFYPGANVYACCMVFTLGRPHRNSDGTLNETFFGHYCEDGFRKRKNLGRIEQFENGESKWKAIEDLWIRLYRNKSTLDGFTACKEVTSGDEWLCESFMMTDYSSLRVDNFIQTINKNMSFLMLKDMFWRFMASFRNGETIVEPLERESIIDTEQWKYFSITKLFDIIRGRISSLNDVDEGSVPIVSASGENEGIDFFGDVEQLFYNNITVSMNGVNTGFSAYHQYGFNANQDCGVLVQKFEMNEYVGLFLTTIINLLKPKYCYARKMSKERLSTEYLKLPIKQITGGAPFIDPERKFSEEGYVPDWNYMESFVRKLLHQMVSI